MDYATKWVEAIALWDNKSTTVAQFLYQNIMSQFGYPIKLISDQGTHFLNSIIQELTATHMVSHKLSSPYHLQANGQAESSNKVLLWILKKIVSENKKDWDDKLDSALWSFRTAFKVATRLTPFKLVYGPEAIIPMEFVIPNLQITAVHCLSLEDSLPSRLD